jgi:two-component system response regulator NreC
VRNPIRIQVCDDHAIVRSGLRALLEGEPGLSVVGESASAGEALEHVRAGRPDVLLLDVVMPGRSGIDALPEIRAAAPDTRVLMLSMQDDPAYVRQAFANGASGYLLKDAADDELVQAIHEVAEGRRYVHPSLGARIAVADNTVADRAPGDARSKREHEVLRLLALGHTNQEIAKLLFVSVRTVETHRAQIGRKLGVKSRAEIVRYALASGDLALEHAEPAA